MLIGVLSDSHGRHLAVRRAVELFDRLGVEHIVHCGDVGGTHVFDELVGRECTFVWGNTDDRGDGIEEYLRTVALREPLEVPTILQLDGKTLAVFHGHEHGFRRALRELEVDYILHGHTHVAASERVGTKRVINPGALCRARPTTVATLDLATDELIFHEIGERR